jgi:hypothetical protein
MNFYNYVILSCLALCAGIFLFCLVEEWIIIYIPTSKSDKVSTTHQCTPRSITLYKWSEGIWHSDIVPIVTPQHSQELLTLIVSAWLSMAYEEQLISYHVSLQSALCSLHEDTVYLSFSETIVQQNKSTFDNLLLIESLLRTIRTNTTQIHSCVFLVHHKPMQDAHLDFSQPWPITGFMHTKISDE